MPSSNDLQVEKMSLSNFAANLRAAIARSGLTQAELAEQTSCTQPDISRYLSLNRIPSGDKLVELALALGTTAEYLITGKAGGVDEVSHPRKSSPRISQETLDLAKQAAEAVVALNDRLKKLA